MLVLSPRRLCFRLGLVSDRGGQDTRTKYIERGVIRVDTGYQLTIDAYSMTS